MSNREPSGSEPSRTTDGSSTWKRRYESPLRDEQARRTQQRIVDAGVELAKELGSWDWRSITYKAVAARAEVNERTAYRYFPSQRLLFQAIIDQMTIDSEVSYEDLELEDVTALTEKVFRSMAEFGPSPAGSPNEVFSAIDRQRRQALSSAMRGTADGDDVPLVAAVLDVLWSAEAYQRLAGPWRLETGEAIEAVSWAIDVLVDAVRDGRGPELSGGESAGVRI